MDAGRAGVAGARGARQVLDNVSACSAPTIADRVRGQEQGVRVGEVLGDTCELQDMLFHGLLALGKKGEHVVAISMP